ILFLVYVSLRMILTESAKDYVNKSITELEELITKLSSLLAEHPNIDPNVLRDVDNDLKFAEGRLAETRKKISNNPDWMAAKGLVSDGLESARWAKLELDKALK
ncbi:MAG: hypothetical protein NT120_04270, partial [Candidatus Aenigmarchaeota archaeon]|nr:hypothetical protein [Candidatus Aenigmarchaeota archaeon]